MENSLLIVFVKNIRPGKVKTRLAKSIGDEKACQVYKHLVKITESVTNQIVVDKRIYFSDMVVENKWEGSEKFIQEGEHLGEKMEAAFEKGFIDGYSKIVLIGSDLPDISVQLIQQGLNELTNNEVVLGPAEDGGYYLIGLTKNQKYLFKDKPWSTPELLQITLNELEEKHTPYALLETLNDLDTLEDLKKSKLASDYL